MARGIKVEGLNETAKAFDRLGVELGGPRMSAVLKDGTDVWRKALASISPRGPTGNLKRSWISYAPRTARSALGRIAGAINRRGPAAFMLGLKRLAPHLHLVLFGTKGRRFPKTASVLKFRSRGGSTVFARSVAAMPANNFFNPTIRAWTPLVKQTIDRGLRRLVEQVNRAIGRGIR